MGWRWHQLDHMQIICVLLQTDNHASIPQLFFFTGRMPLLQPKQQHQSTEGINYKYNNAVQWYGDCAGNTDEENSSVFSIIRMC